jgi:hypothetical protein
MEDPPHPLGEEPLHLQRVLGRLHHVKTLNASWRTQHHTP